MTLKAGTRVSIDFGIQCIEGTLVRDCEDWGADILLVRDDETGGILRAKGWLAESVEVVD